MTILELETTKAQDDRIIKMIHGENTTSVRIEPINGSFNILVHHRDLDGRVHTKEMEPNGELIFTFL